MSTLNRDDLLAVAHDPAAPLAVRQFASWQLAEYDRPLDLWPTDKAPVSPRVSGGTNPALGWLILTLIGVLSGGAGALVVWGITEAIRA